MMHGNRRHVSSSIDPKLLDEEMSEEHPGEEAESPESEMAEPHHARALAGMRAKEMTGLEQRRQFMRAHALAQMARKLGGGMGGMGGAP